ncbi:tRNA (adenosine(37)-N6)-threonylcarbamoyltransferase complex transferase subunit TsaD [candidate division WWE3 bacterium RBG_19FT_COMBO_34_6]|uniref:tRNA N6-adenosine threonylcarbamoyltransferase n=1 Tax=candidate division WWE3 bacterium RBG_19FT_COMBO_34_6 TaxID=1802612 RepID=A0A1F4UMK5_UNCKA|nr:MAG: tRNA (adenosine(37)-N6)-threonylcarbamoyltransferase complex transferase subunit TsaD [candidate division WWE3 bacterium RBG_19FT_COMBO_34_6]
MKIFAIETSCDETSCSIIEDGIKEIVTITTSSANLHLKTGGVVPEVAARKQSDSILPAIDECIKTSGLDDLSQIDKFAVTVGPGLIGSLVVGVSAAKSLSLLYQKPLIPVNHLIGHIYGNFINNEHYKEIKFPAIVLIVSGGHTDLVLMKDHGVFEYLGGTLDDAAGEAFDKVARLLGFSRYLGGAELSRCAASCTDKLNYNLFPRAMLDRDNYDFSFSGLKTASLRAYEKNTFSVSQLAYEFEASVVDVLVGKTIKAAQKYKVGTILLGGGVSANKKLREQIFEEGKRYNKKVFFPNLSYCGDSAAYIAGAAYFTYKKMPKKQLQDIIPDPSLTIMDVYP